VTVTRLLFLAEYRVPHACFSLQWDHMLQGIDITIVCHTQNLDAQQLNGIFTRHGIDISNFSYISDAVIYDRYPQVNDWVFPGDYRTYWLRQQAIKLAYVDLIDRDVMLQDPDTFMIKPYRPCTDGKLHLMSLLNTTQGSYEGMFKAITGLPRPTPHCFVTELASVRRADWHRLRQLISQRWPHRHWLNAIIDAVPGMPTVPPWGDGSLIRWFSEYELLGGWAVICGNVDHYEQRRFEYDDLDQLANLDATEFNAVCDAVPDLTRGMQLDQQTQQVINFDLYKSWVDRALG